MKLLSFFIFYSFLIQLSFSSIGLCEGSCFDEAPSFKSLPITGIGKLYNHYIEPGSIKTFSIDTGKSTRFKLYIDSDPKGEWNVEILDGSDTIVERIEPEKLLKGYWTNHIWSNNITIKVPKNGQKILVSMSLESKKPVEVQNVIPSNSLPSFKPVNGYFSLEKLPFSNSIVHLRIIYNNIERPCTGFLISDQFLITNEHCVSNEKMASQTSVWIGYENESKKPFEILTVKELVISNYELDFSILKLDEPVSINFNIFKWRLSTLNYFEKVLIIQHPNGEIKQFSSDSDCYISNPKLKGRSGLFNDFGHRCDTKDGSSGSPILDNQYKLIGIHHWGLHPGDKLEYNQGVSIEKVYSYLNNKIRAKEFNGSFNNTIESILSKLQ